MGLDAEGTTLWISETVTPPTLAGAHQYFQLDYNWNLFDA